MNLSMMFIFAKIILVLGNDNQDEMTIKTPEPKAEVKSNVYWIHPMNHQESRMSHTNITLADSTPTVFKNLRRKNAIQIAAFQGLHAMMDLYERKEPEILRKGELLGIHHPASKLSHFSAPMTNESDFKVRGAYASLFAAKKLQESLNLDFTGLGRQASKKISLKKTSLEGLCPLREQPQCLPATRRYRTHDGTCNNIRRLRWGSAQLPFNRFLPPVYSDGLEKIRTSVTGEPLPSSRLVSLVVHGYREEEAPITMLLPQFGQLLDHDLTSTLGQRSIGNGSVPSCCRSQEPHPSCLPIKVPRDDPFLGNLGVRCLEFLRSAPAQRRDCFLSWREQTNQVTSFIDASSVYSSNPRTADSSRTQRDGLLFFGKGPPGEDSCLRGGFGQCIRAGDSRAGEQPGLLALHTVFVAEHNRITLELSDLNPHWSDEKLYQETRRIIGSIFQHITYREFLPLVLGKEVCRLFDLELEPSGYYRNYDQKVNPTVANAFSTAAFRFGHALIQGSIMRSDINYRFLTNNVSLHEENSFGDIGLSGSLHRIIRGMASQRTLKRDEFMSPELTNHLFQSDSFSFGMDLAAINIQRGRDHGLPAYVNWRQPCGLSEIRSWEDLEVVAGPKSVERMRRAYVSFEDIDLFVGGISERPVAGGLVGPTFACIIAQQFSNLRRGDRFWYENPGFESSFTLAQLVSVKQTTLSQILCRSLGNSNFIQPHAFLPPEFVGNERLRCGSGILAPINLSAWIERDPFNKDVDLTNLLLVQSTETGPFNKPLQASKQPEHLDLENDSPLLTTARTKPVKTTVDNKLDFPTTFTKPTRTTVVTRRPIAIIDNKLDFGDGVTKRPNSPFSKLEDSVNLLNLKHEKLKDLELTIDADHLNKTGPFKRQDFHNETDDLHNITRLSKTFGMFENDDPEKINRKSYDYDYERRTYRPYYDDNKRTTNYYPTYPPSFQSEIIQRPLNKRPNNDQTETRPVSTPISNKYSTPFSYDTFNSDSGSISSPQINYNNMVNPLYISSNRNIRPSNQKRNKRTFLMDMKKDFGKTLTTPYHQNSSSSLTLSNSSFLSSISSTNLIHFKAIPKLSSISSFDTIIEDPQLTEKTEFTERSRNRQLVPFKLLTRIDRPDDWVNVDIKYIKTLLPDQPALRQDISEISGELPKPILKKKNKV